MGRKSCRRASCGEGGAAPPPSVPIRQRLRWEFWGSAVGPRRRCPTLGYPSVARTPLLPLPPPGRTALCPHSPFPTSPQSASSPPAFPLCARRYLSHRYLHRCLSSPVCQLSLFYPPPSFPTCFPSLCFIGGLCRAVAAGMNAPEACAHIHTDEKCSPGDAASTWARKTPPPSQCHGVRMGQSLQLSTQRHPEHPSGAGSKKTRFSLISPKLSPEEMRRTGACPCTQQLARVARGRSGGRIPLCRSGLGGRGGSSPGPPLPRAAVPAWIKPLDAPSEREGGAMLQPPNCSRGRRAGKSQRSLKQMSFAPSLRPDPSALRKRRSPNEQQRWAPSRAAWAGAHTVHCTYKHTYNACVQDGIPYLYVQHIYTCVILFYFASILMQIANTIKGFTKSDPVPKIPIFKSRPSKFSHSESAQRHL